MAAQPSEEHAGYEIYFEPDVSGWRYRRAETASSAQSYRSAFLARKAVEQMVAAGGPSVATKSLKRRK